MSWEALDTATLGSRLGANGYLAKLTVIVENSGVEAMNVALGETTLLVEGIEFTKELTVSVAVTQGDYVISDIAEADFTTGMPAPSFSTEILISGGVGGTDTAFADGRFYYLGFNDLFDNWYVVAPEDIPTRPESPKFRVGLAHGTGITSDDAEDASFEHYRITIEDSDGDFLGYQAKTVVASRTYNDPIHFGRSATQALTDITFPNKFTNIRLSNRHDDGPASPYYAPLTLDCNAH